MKFYYRVVSENYLKYTFEIPIRYMYDMGGILAFEFDLNKSIRNRTKHGIDFDDAQKLWYDEDGVEIRSKSSRDEERYMRIAMLYDKHWSAIFTLRPPNIRIISVRRARAEEREFYDFSK